MMSMINRSHSGTPIMSIFSLQTILISQVPMSPMCGRAPVLIVQNPPNCTFFSRQHVVPVPTVSSPIIHCLIASSMMSAVRIGWSAMALSHQSSSHSLDPAKYPCPRSAVTFMCCHCTIHGVHEMQGLECDLHAIRGGQPLALHSNAVRTECACFALSPSEHGCWRRSW